MLVVYFTEQPMSAYPEAEGLDPGRERESEPGSSEEGSELRAHPIGVLEQQQQTEVEGDGDSEQAPAPRPPVTCPLHEQTEGVVRGDAREHHEHEATLTPGVEEQAEDEQFEVPPALGRRQRHRQDDRQEQEGEDR